MSLPSRRAKIVATLGPSSSETQTIENLMKAGVNVFRLNLSHGNHADHRQRFERIRAASTALGRTVGILMDLQGPKLRVGTFPGGSIELEKGREVTLVIEGGGGRERKAAAKAGTIPYNYENLPREIAVGHRIMLDDGNIELVVTGIKGTDISAQVVFGGTLKNLKGMNFPDTRIGIESFTPKDREDLLFGMGLGVDYIALSFVRSAADVRAVQRFMHAHKKNIPVVAKIEKGEAIANLADILSVADAVMVARGDLAVEVGTAQVPALQKQIIYQCNQRGIPVITATQMLESMISSPRPTRAEASDVANAVLDGTDALMLSAETASGKFPVLAVSVMHNIILETELQYPALLETAPNGRADRHAMAIAPSLVEAIEHAAARVASWLGARAIACTTHTGTAARALARYRPPVPIVAFTDDVEVQRRLTLVWGVETAAISRTENLEKLFAAAEEELTRRRLVGKGDLIVLTAGWPPLKHGTTNLLKVVTVRLNPEGEEAKTRRAGKAAPEEAIQGYRTRNAQFILDQNLCIQCGGCVEVCPNDIFGQDGRRVYLKESNCKNCTFDDACMEICPTGAVEVIRFGD